MPEQCTECREHSENLGALSRLLSAPLSLSLSLTEPRGPLGVLTARRAQQTPNWRQFRLFGRLCANKDPAISLASEQSCSNVQTVCCAVFNLFLPALVKVHTVSHVISTLGALVPSLFLIDFVPLSN